VTKPYGPIVGQIHLDDGTHTKFIWVDEQGLQNPAGNAVGSMVDTFAGPVMLQPNWVATPIRSLTFPGYLFPIASSVTVTTGQKEMMDWFRKVYDRIGKPGINSRVTIGNSYYRGFPDAVEINKFKSHGKILGYNFDLRPNEGAWIQSYRSAINPGGFARIRYDSPFLERSSTATIASTPFLINNPGDMPTKLVCTLTFSAAIRTTRFFLRVIPKDGQQAQRVALTPNSSGVAYVSELDNVYLAPGDNYLRVEEASGAYVTTSTIHISCYGTKWRYSSPSGPDLWPTLAASRRTRGYYSTSTTSTSSQSIRFPDEVRQGTIDNYNANNAGVIVEADSNNVLRASEDHDNVTYWTVNNASVTPNNIASPNNTNTGDRITNTALLGGVYQDYTTSAASKWTFSLFAKTATSGTTINLAIDDITGGAPGTNLVSTNFTITSSWQRFSVTTPASVASARILRVQIGIPNVIGGNADVWGSQLEALSYRSSYIPSPTWASTSNSFRGMDTIYLDNPHNYLAYSNDFFKQTTTQGTPGLWFLDSGCTISNTRVAGPDITPLTATQITYAASGDYIEQTIINSEMLTGLTRVVLSGWVRNSSTTARSSILFGIVNQAGTSINSATFTTYENWTRFAIPFNISAGTTVGRIRIEGTGANTQYIYGLQLTNHAWVGDTSSPIPELPEVYTETQASPILPDNTGNWPVWMSQNGYVQFDIRNNETSRPDAEGRLFFGGFSNTGAIPEHPVCYRASATTSANNNVTFYRRTIASGIVAAIDTAVNLYDGAFHTIRLEWFNYVLNNARIMQVKLFIDGVLRQTTNAGASETAWATPPKMIFAQGRNVMISTQTFRCNSVYKNISMGVPELPAGAIPAEY
jgi:hypothetical protein